MALGGVCHKATAVEVDDQARGRLVRLGDGHRPLGLRSAVRNDSITAAKANLPYAIAV
jgi:hypothetical protein